jgi:hypothetical protein
MPRISPAIDRANGILRANGIPFAFRQYQTDQRILPSTPVPTAP